MPAEVRSGGVAGAAVAAAALSAVAMRISPRRDCMCPCTRECRACPTRLSAGSGSPEGRPASPGSLPHPPQPGPLRPAPADPGLGPASRLTAALSRFTFTGFWPPSLPSVRHLCLRRAGPAAGSPSPLLACRRRSTR